MEIQKGYVKIKRNPQQKQKPNVKGDEMAREPPDVTY